MQTFLDNFHQGVKYTAKIYIHQSELSREQKFAEQNILSITYLQTDYLNIGRISSSGRNNERENIVQKM